MTHISSRIYFYVSRKHNVTFWAKYYCMCQAADLYARVCYFMVTLCCSCVEKDKGPAPRTNTFPLVCATLLFSSYFSFCDYGLFRNNAAILMRIGRDTEASKRLRRGPTTIWDDKTFIGAAAFLSIHWWKQTLPLMQPNVNTLNLLCKCTHITYVLFYEKWELDSKPFLSPTLMRWTSHLLWLHYYIIISFHSFYLCILFAMIQN